MVSVEYDLRYYRAGLALLENYFLSKDLYWPPPDSQPEGEPPYLSMTLGSWLLARKRLEKRTLTSPQQVEITKLDLTRDALLLRWRTAWERKADIEARARINQWTNFIADYREHPTANANNLVTEGRSRAILEILSLELPQYVLPQDYREALANLDANLKARWQPGAFHWPPELASIFPMSPFWYLYGSLDSSEIKQL